MGQIYQLTFYPEQGKRLSPFDFLLSLDPIDQARVYRHLEILRDLYLQYWQNSSLTIKLIAKDLYQLTSGPIRSYICIDDKTLVVVYMCRKVSNETKRIDKQRAIGNMVRYFQED